MKRILLLAFLTLQFSLFSQTISPTNGTTPGLSATPPGWTFTAGSPDVSDTDGPNAGVVGPFDCAVDLPPNGHEDWIQGVCGGVTELSQTIITGLTPGETYTFCFNAGNFHGTGGFWGGASATRNQTTNLVVDGVVAGSVTFVGDVCYWQEGEATFTAGGPTAVLTMSATPTDNVYCWWHISITADAFDICDVDCTDLTTTASATEVCIGEEVTLEATSETGGMVTWDGGVTNGVAFTPPLGTTTYTTTSDSDLDCPYSIDITVNDLPDVTADASDDLICLGDEVTVTGGGAETYVWDPLVDDGVAFTPVDIGATTYTVTGTDANGCVNTADVTITVEDLPIIDAGADVTVCDGEEVTLAGSGAGVDGTYDWDGGITDGVAFTPGATTVYTVTGTTATGCSNTDDVTVTVNPLPVIDAGPDIEICEGEEVTLSGSGAGMGGVYVWDGGVTDGVAFTPVATTTYTVTGTDVNGCEGTDDVTVTLEAAPDIDAGDDLSICEGESLTLNATGLGFGGVYDWDGGVTNGVAFTPATTTTYTVIGTSDLGCSGTDEVTVTVSPIPTVSFAGDVLSGCAPLQVNFESFSPGAEYSWEFGDGSIGTGAMTTHTYSTAGLYSVTLTITSAEGCSNTATYAGYIDVVEVPVAQFTYSPTSITVADTRVNFKNTSLYADSYEWDFGDGSELEFAESPSHLYPKVGDRTYLVHLTATNDFGCEDIAEQIITVKDALIYYIPNVFTPDGDSFNEEFKPIFYSGMDIYDFHMTIFNRWGEIVFETYDANYGWNGSYGGGDIVEDGVYVYKIEFGDTMSDERYYLTGHITILK